MRLIRRLLISSILLLGTAALGWIYLSAAIRDPTPSARYDRGDNALWLRRHWLHGERPPELTVPELTELLRAHGIRRIYPFLGPMNEQGHPGWRGRDGHNPYSPEEAGLFLKAMAEEAPEVTILPWTGGRLNRDVALGSLERVEPFLVHCRTLMELGAHGIHLNVEPLPTGNEDYLELLRRVKETIGPEGVLSVAAYPPPTIWHPIPEVHWRREYITRVARQVDEMAFMTYDTAIRFPRIYSRVLARWTRIILEAVPPPDQGGAEILLGVPTYDDETDSHRRWVENPATALRGIRTGLARIPVPDHFRGIAVYAAWTTDDAEWQELDRSWRGQFPSR